jgi:hypothetical protein
MNIKSLIPFFIATLCLFSCATQKNGSDNKNASNTLKANLTSYNELTMDLASDPVLYTIDVTTPAGELKLRKLSLSQAKDLALTEALIQYQCAVLFNPQYTYLTKGNKVLRITVYGYPARYKNKQ